VIRIALSYPDGESVARRGREEGIGDGLAARTRLMLAYLQGHVGDSGVELRLHDETVYASMFRFDDDMLINCHAYGAPAAQSLVLHLRRVAGGRMVEHYLASFERTWALGRPLSLSSTAEEAV
jgi:hypothetical protein